MNLELETWLLNQENLMWETSHYPVGRNKVEVRMCEEGELLGSGESVLDALTAAMTRCAEHHP